MAGYNWILGKSNNAVNAERKGLMTSSKIAKKFKIDSEFIRLYVPYAEYHHTSKFYNITYYYDLDEVTEYLESEAGQAQLDRWKKYNY